MLYRLGNSLYTWVVEWQTRINTRQNVERTKLTRKLSKMNSKEPYSKVTGDHSRQHRKAAG
jgi:hypothetical protein